MDKELKDKAFEISRDIFNAGMQAGENPDRINQTVEVLDGKYRICYLVIRAIKEIRDIDGH